MAKLAIRGHATRGSEVIKILEMMGGENHFYYDGTFTELIYTIGSELELDIFNINSLNVKNDYIIFTLEEFLKKFPYKVGDKVYNIIHNENQTITNLVWIENEIVYQTNNKEYVYVNYLQPYKEETMEEQNEKSVNHVYVSEVISFDIAQKDKYELDLQGKFEVKLRDGKYFVERIKPQYPKTYIECAKILNCFGAAHIDGYKGELLDKFQELLICRDAYWKIAGEQMGLGKPWEPDWLNTEQDKFVLYTHNNVICLNRFVLGHNVLAFPTEEMRDAFIENFKELIELCKELL